nr:hypothetical protein [Tanacetum cinerariifolium]
KELIGLGGGAGANIGEGGDSIGGNGGKGICGGGEDQGDNGSSSSSSSGCISKSDSGTYSGNWVIGEASSAYVHSSIGTGAEIEILAIVWYARCGGGVAADSSVSNGSVSSTDGA